MARGAQAPNRRTSESGAPLIRWAHAISAILTRYVGTEATFTDAGLRFSHESATDRIVVYPVDGTIEEPDIAALGALLEDLEPSATALTSLTIDDIIFSRRVNTVFELWAPDAVACENRYHALLVALSDVVNTTIQVSGLREVWPNAQGDITDGGVMVLLYATITILVVRSDERVITESAPVGSGTATSPVTSTEIDPSLDDEALAPTITEAET
jgi:hypothetical protein